MSDVSFMQSSTSSFLTNHSIWLKVDLAQASVLLCYYMLTRGMIEEASMVITAREGSTRYPGSEAPQLTGERVHQKEELALRRTIACLERFLFRTIVLLKFIPIYA